jgi:hypothetical protein
VTSDRKAAIAAYKERKTFAGVFAIRCKASPQAWSARRPTWRRSRTGSGSRCARAATPAAPAGGWTAHGPDSLTFEECERLEEEETPYIRDALLKERALHWRSQLNAEAV